MSKTTNFHTSFIKDYQCYAPKGISKVKEPNKSKDQTGVDKSYLHHIHLSQNASVPLIQSQGISDTTWTNALLPPPGLEIMLTVDTAVGQSNWIVDDVPNMLCVWHISGKRV